VVHEDLTDKLVSQENLEKTENQVQQDLQDNLENEENLDTQVPVEMKVSVVLPVQLEKMDLMVPQDHVDLQDHPV